MFGLRDVTEETYRVFYGDALEAIEGWLAGAPVRVLAGRAGAG